MFSEGLKLPKYSEKRTDQSQDDYYCLLKLFHPLSALVRKMAQCQRLYIMMNNI